MATLSQNRIAPLSLKMQQAAGSTIASMISQQVVDKYTTDFTLFEAKDRFPVDATGGAITVTVPLMTALPIGKPFIVEKIAGGNDVTLQLSGDDEFEGDDAVAAAGGRAAPNARKDTAATRGLALLPPARRCRGRS